ncbi:DUF3140 domain-containing protein [Actinomadura hibisca]|uniref:DUF3140 domain-containing protein n=1 Tax=Actinomadura hibisca TaxID=68565 RepID=UPI0008305CC9|nr:DUF3140 domain-containing protein [Actinomadura hibisca]
MNERLSAEVELLWDDFHRTVNMTSEELRAWLLTDASGEDALPADPDMKVPELGKRVVEILRKRKVDLTSDDVADMRQVVEHADELLEKEPPDGAQDERWRHALMTVGHDPLKPENALRL